MTKRAAIGISGALLAALMSGVVALWFGHLTAMATAQPASTFTPKPIIRTVTRVITVHKRRKPKFSGVPQTITVVRPAPPAVAPVVTTSGGSGGEGYDDGGHEHDHGGGGDD